MNDRPDALELLQIARSTLLEAILPQLPDDLRYSALMVANAMAIAGREIAAGESPGEAERVRVRALLTEAPDSRAAESSGATLIDCNRRLVAAIYAGRFDGDERAALLEHLQRTATDKLAVSNPKALDSSTVR